MPLYGQTDITSKNRTVRVKNGHLVTLLQHFFKTIIFHSRSISIGLKRRFFVHCQKYQMIHLMIVQSIKCILFLDLQNFPDNKNANRTMTQKIWNCRRRFFSNILTYLHGKSHIFRQFYLRNHLKRPITNNLNAYFTIFMHF